LGIYIYILGPEPQKDLIPQMIRKKDRLSYISHPFCIDLTQVKQVNVFPFFMKRFAQLLTHPPPVVMK
jgi:hypothetical protein